MPTRSKINHLALTFKESKDEQDFNKIYNELYLPILNFSKKFLKDFFKYNPGVAYREAPVIANEAFTKAYTKIYQFNPQYQFTTWIYTIAKNLCRRFINKYKRRKEISFNFNIPSFAQEADAAQLRNGIVAAEPLWANMDYELDEMDESTTFKKILREGLQNLSENYRSILIDYRFKDMKYREIADERGLKLNTVKTKIYRARKKLKDECRKIKERYVEEGLIEPNAQYAH